MVLPRPRLVIGLCGLPGAGKTSVADALQEQHDLRLVDRDRIRAAMFPLCAYSDVEKQAANEAVLAAVAANCRLGFDTLIDGMTFSSRVERREFGGVVRDCGGRFVLLYLDCSLETARERIRAHGSDHPAGDREPELADEVAARFEPPEGEGLRLDAELAPVEVARQASDAVTALIEMYRGV